jgi:hypothetical protein
MRREILRLRRLPALDLNRLPERDSASLPASLEIGRQIRLR